MSRLVLSSFIHVATEVLTETHRAASPSIPPTTPIALVTESDDIWDHGTRNNICDLLAVRVG